MEEDRLNKNNWEDAIASPFPCLYMKIYKEFNFYRKDDTLKSLYDQFIKETIFTLSKKLGKKIIVADLLSAFGNCLLTLVYGLTSRQIYDLMETEEKARKLKDSITRTFDCETIGTDISKTVLEYGKSQLFFDKTFQYDLNKIFEEKENFEVTKNLMTNSNLIHFGSICYIKDDVLSKMIEWFSNGTEEGYILMSFAYPIDITERNNFLKKKFLEKLDFVASQPGQHREFFGLEKEKYDTPISYQETWCFKRKLK